MTGQKINKLHRKYLTPVGGSSVMPESSGPSSRHYLRPYLRWLRWSDVFAIGTAAVVAQVARFGFADELLASAGGLDAVSYTYVSIALVVGWAIFLHLQGAYDGRYTGHGVQEYRAVVNATFALFGLLAIVSFVFRLDFARGYVLIAFPLGTLLLLTGRWLARRWLVHHRAAGKLSDKVLVVGDYSHVNQLVAALRRVPGAGYQVHGACVSDHTSRTGTVAGVPIVGDADEVAEQARTLGIDVVAVSSSAGLGSNGLRELGWALEGSNIDLVVSPDIMDVAGPRVKTRPVQGLPLIHVESPTFAGPQLIFKQLLDKLLAVALLLIFSPLMIAVAFSIYRGDRGPIFFRQERVGRGGDTFRMWKFRSMVTGAEDQRAGLMDQNDGAGPLFKMKDDPRVTKIGAFIRRYSIDELPQLFNVLVGDMSVVGPRPPLPSEVAEYEEAAHRRLLVRPGMTGLWQISGRSDLEWSEAVRLDLYYVENWTPVLDVMILWRTVAVVLFPDKAGAY